MSCPHHHTPQMLRDAIRVAELLAESLLAYWRGDTDAANRGIEQACVVDVVKATALRDAWLAGAVPEPGTAGWTAHLDQLRAELAAAERATGDRP